MAFTFESLNKIWLKVKFLRSSCIPYHFIPAPALFCWHPPRRLFFPISSASRHVIVVPFPVHLSLSILPRSRPLSPPPQSPSSIHLFVDQFFATSVGPLQNFKQAQGRHHCAHSPMKVKKASLCIIFTQCFAQSTLSVESESFLTVFVGYSTCSATSISIFILCCKLCSRPSLIVALCVPNSNASKH